jgi:hypothetical protein
MSHFTIIDDDFAPERATDAAEKVGADLPDVEPRCHKSRTRHVYRRAFSESKLLEVMPYELEDETSYHVMSGGNVDSLSFIKAVIRLQRLDYLLFSTWCMAHDDIAQIKEWCDAGKIGRLDAYVGEIFTGSYATEHRALLPIVRATGGRICIFRNHSKVYAGIGEKFAFGVESSANINTNPRTENTCLTVGRGIFDFYKSFFDGVKSFQRDFDDWTPWNG